jgi:hypothetical protein
MKKALLALATLGAFASASTGVSGGAEASQRTRSFNPFNRRFSWPRIGKEYPYSSTKQHDKAAQRNYMKVVNGFEIMQTRSGKEIRAMHAEKLAA